MQVWAGLDAVPAGAGPSVVSIGVFDGVHRGHAAVLGRAVALARQAGRAAVAVTFDPHPVEVVRPGVHVPRLTTLSRRVALIAELGIDACLVLPFTAELASLPAPVFADSVLRAALNAAEVVVGADFRFGHRAAGDVQTLRDLGFAVDAIAPVGNGERWSSTAVRTALERGRVEDAAVILGRPHRLEGVVVRGDQRGRELGYPTANLAVVGGLLVPADGVYAGWLGVQGERLPAAISVGANATFDGVERRVEAYALDRADLDLYDEPASLDLVTRLRPMVRFDGVEPLLAQMARDVAEARAVLVPTAR